MGEWKMVRRCASCKAKHSNHDIAFSQGVCSKCGARAPRTNVGPYGHHLMYYTEAVEYCPSLWERLIQFIKGT